MNMLPNTLKTTIPDAAGIAGTINVDTALTILFGITAIVLGVLQVLFSWQGVRELRHRNATA